jgi:hypothetical protein
MATPRPTLFLTFLFIATAAWGATPQLNISLKAGNEPEKKAKVLIEGFSQQYDLKPYIFTPNILIEAMAIPHSQPTLTLNTRQIREPKRYLGVLLHEEIHWFFDKPDRTAKTKAFIAKMKSKYPTVPSREQGGADDAESTYLHFGVCYYELLAMSKLVGEKDAVQIFETEDVYPWVRKQVLANRDFVAKALVDSGLAWSDAGS